MLTLKLADFDGSGEIDDSSELLAVTEHLVKELIQHGFFLEVKSPTVEVRCARHDCIENPLSVDEYQAWFVRQFSLELPSD